MANIIATLLATPFIVGILVAIFSEQDIKIDEF